MGKLVAWLPSTAEPGREPELAEVTNDLGDCVFIHRETGKDRWIPADWIVEEA